MWNPSNPCMHGQRTLNDNDDDDDDDDDDDGETRTTTITYMHDKMIVLRTLCDGAIKIFFSCFPNRFRLVVALCNLHAVSGCGGATWCMKIHRLVRRPTQL